MAEVFRAFPDDAGLLKVAPGSCHLIPRDGQEPVLVLADTASLEQGHGVRIIDTGESLRIGSLSIAGVTIISTALLRPIE